MKLNSNSLKQKNYLEDKVINIIDLPNNTAQSESKNTNEDPLDNFMNSIKNEASMQDYELYQEYYNQQLQKKYDDFADKDGNEYDENVRDDVKMIEDEEDYDYKHIDSSKVITLEEIMKNCKASSNETNDNQNGNGTAHKNGQINNGNYNNNGKSLNSRDNDIEGKKNENQVDLGNYKLH